MTKVGLLKEVHSTNYGTWYDCLNEINEKKSVVYAEFFDTTSSSGEWGGIIIQKLGNTLYCYLFSQENNYPNSGFTITLASPIIVPFAKDISYDVLAKKLWGIE